MNDPLSPLYGAGARQLQDEFDSRRLADRLVDITLHEELTDRDVALIQAQSSVLISTVDLEGWPDVSYKGGDVGFVRVVDRATLDIPSYDGNGMFRTLGNVVDTGRVALLFIDTTKPYRIRLHGTATVLTSPDEVANYHGAEAVLRVSIGRVFPNCGRYIHPSPDDLSEFVPRVGHEPPVPDWKSYDAFRDALPNRSMT